MAPEEILSPTLHRLGETGLIVEFAPKLSDAANRAALAFCTAIDGAGWKGLAESFVTLKSCAIRFDPEILPHAEIEARLQELLQVRNWAAAPLPAGRKLWHIPTAFGGAEGPQLSEVADLAGLSETALVEELCATRLRVLTIGFAPGQPYLGLLPPRWDIPRQAGLTPQIPRGAVAAAVRQLILFTVPTQTGWRQVGLSAFEGYRPRAAEPFPFSVGDEVAFEPVSAAVLAQWRARAERGDLAARVEDLP